MLIIGLIFRKKGLLGPSSAKSSHKTKEFHLSKIFQTYMVRSENLKKGGKKLWLSVYFAGEQRS